MWLNSLKYFEQEVKSNCLGLSAVSHDRVFKEGNLGKLPGWSSTKFFQQWVEYPLPPHTRERSRSVSPQAAHTLWGLLKARGSGCIDIAK